MSTETSDVWPRRRNRRSRRSSIQDDTAATVSYELQDDLDDAPPSRQSSFPRTDSGDSRRVYFDPSVYDRDHDRDRDRDRSPARSETWNSCDQRPSRIIEYRWPRGMRNQTPIGFAISQYVGRQVSAFGPESICDALVWGQVSGVLAGLAIALTLSAADGYAANGFAVGTFVTAACATVLASLQSRHLAAGCRCTPEMCDRADLADNAVSRRRFARHMRQVHDHIEELRAESARYLRTNRASNLQQQQQQQQQQGPPSFMPARAATMPSGPGRRGADDDRERDGAGAKVRIVPPRQSSIIVMSDSDEDPEPTVATPETQTVAGSLTEKSHDGDAKTMDGGKSKDGSGKEIV